MTNLRLAARQSHAFRLAAMKAQPIEQTAGAPGGRFSHRWVETAATSLIAITAVFTAWAAFQAAKWNGVQAQESRLAAAAGTAAARETTIAATQKSVDVGTFLNWLQALQTDAQAGKVDLRQPYAPDSTTLSGFIALRFREEFKPAFDTWLTSEPLVNSSAPATPFELPEYSLEAEAQADQMIGRAQASASSAQVAASRAENYVLLTVLFAIALVLANVGARQERQLGRTLLLSLAIVVVVAATIVMVAYPKQL